MTGRAMGYCNGNDVPGSMVGPGPLDYGVGGGREHARGRRGGHGCGIRLGRSAWPRWGKRRAADMDPQSLDHGRFGYAEPASEQEERDLLEMEISATKRRLAALERERGEQGEEEA